MTDQMTSLVHIMSQLITPRPGHRHIFVFNELMAEDRFRKHCPDAEFVTTTQLRNRQWMVNDDGIATILPCRGRVVHGVIFEISATAQADLETHLDLPNAVDRFGSFARGHAGELITTEFYASRNRNPGSATADYLGPIIAAAQRWKLPHSYADEIAEWAQTEPRTVMHMRGAR